MDLFILYLFDSVFFLFSLSVKFIYLIFSGMDSGLGKYHSSVWSIFSLFHNQPCLLLNSFLRCSTALACYLINCFIFVTAYPILAILVRIVYFINYHYNYFQPDISLAVRVFANGPGDRGSIPGRVIPKTQKMVLDASLLNTQHYKVRINGKVEQSWERSSVPPTPWCSSYRKGSLRVTLDYGRQLYLLSSYNRIVHFLHSSLLLLLVVVVVQEEEEEDI